MALDSTEVLVNPCRSVVVVERDPTTILLVKDHAPERKESIYAISKMNAL